MADLPQSRRGAARLGFDGNEYFDFHNGFSTISRATPIRPSSSGCANASGAPLTRRAHRGRSGGPRNWPALRARALALTNSARVGDGRDPDRTRITGQTSRKDARHLSRALRRPMVGVGRATNRAPGGDHRARTRLEFHEPRRDGERARTRGPTNGLETPVGGGSTSLRGSESSRCARLGPPRSMLPQPCASSSIPTRASRTRLPICCRS